MMELAQLHARTRRRTQDSEKDRRVPSLCLHKASGRAYVVLSGKAVYCGRYGDPGAQAQYHQVIAEWLAAGQQLPADPATITVKELLARFWTYAEQYYRTLTDGRVKELEQFRLAFRPLKDLYANTPATEFGPRALKTVQQRMIEIGWCRPYVNKQVNRIRHIFRWAVSDEMIPGSVLHALQAVPGLRRGRSDAHEPEAVKPVAMEMVNAIQPHVSRQVWAMVQLQLFTAARAGEIIQMRPCDIDREGNIWVYRPERHKTAHCGFERKVFIGPRGQQVLAPFLLRDPQAYCFCPVEAVEEWRRQAFQSRSTPLSCGNSPGTNRKDRPRWTPGERYTTSSYRIAIVRACDDALPPPEPLAKREDENCAQWQKRLTQEHRAELAAWRRAHRWHPHQLRHNAATELRKGFGIEATRIILGHRSAAVTDKRICPSDWWLPTPPFERKVIEETDSQIVYVNHEGILMRERKDNAFSSMPQFLKFPVTNRQEFRQFWRERMQPDLGRRIGPDWRGKLKQWRAEPLPFIVISDRWGGFFGPLRNLLGLENLCTTFYDDPAFVEEMMDANADLILAIMSQVLEVIHVDAFGFWEDMAYNHGPLISPRMVRRHMLPRYRRVGDFLRSRGVKYIGLDSDGQIDSLIPVWMDAGLNFLYPFEVQCGMDVLAVRKKYGRELRIWGGVNKRALAEGPAAINAELRRVQPLVVEGGYIPHTDHTCPPDISFANYCYYMKRLAQTCGKK